MENPCGLSSGQQELLKTKASIPVSNWNAQYMQQPDRGRGSNLIKRDWWRDWTGKYPPKLDYIIQSYDTAFTKGTKVRFSVLLPLGVCLTTEADGQNILLLRCI